MVSPFYGFGAQLMAKNTLLAGQTLTGHKFTVSELVYNGPPFVGAESNKTYAVDVFGAVDTPQAYGFATREEAERFIHSTQDEEYTAHDTAGYQGTQHRVGLGVPEGMVSRLDGSAAPSLAKLLQAQAVALRAQMDRGQAPGQGQAPDNPDVKPSSNPAPAPAPTVAIQNWPDRDVGPQATGPGVQEPTGGPVPVSRGNNEEDGPSLGELLNPYPSGTEETVSDGSNVTDADLDDTGLDTDSE